MNMILLLTVSLLPSQTTHPSYITIEGGKTLRVFQVIDKNNALVDLETMAPRGGGMSMAPLMRGSVQAQRAIAGSGELTVHKKLLWLVCPTEDMVDDGWGYYEGRMFAYAGTETYETESATRTVPKYRLLSPEEAEKHIDPAIAGVKDMPIDKKAKKTRTNKRPPKKSSRSRSSSPIR